MKKYAIFILSAVIILMAETLFQVKDSQDRVVLDVSTDGLRVYNEGDLLMEISSSDIRAFIDNDPTKGLARSFSVTTSSSSKGETNVLEVNTDATQMREGDQGEKYTDFSPENIFLGLSAGVNTTPNSPSDNDGTKNLFLGNEAGFSNVSGRSNIFIGDGAGYSNTTSHFSTFVGSNAGRNSMASNNTIVGNTAGFSNVSGGANAIFGDFAGAMNTTGGSNSIFGHGAGIYLVAGDHNTFMGYWAGRGAGSGGSDSFYNSLFGSEAGRDLTGDRNVMVGRQSGFSNTQGSGNVFLGHQSGYNETGSNKLYIANSDTSTPLIKGTFPNTDLDLTATNIRLNGNINNHLRVVYPETAVDGLNGTFIDIQNSNGNVNSRMSGLRFQNHGTTSTGPKGAIFFSRSENFGRGDMHFAINNVGDASQVTVSNALMTLERTGDVRIHSRLRVGGNADGTAWVSGVDGNSIVRGQLRGTGVVRFDEAYGYSVGTTNRYLRIDNSGYVGVVLSSERYKENISDVDNVDWLYSLRPVNFNYVNDTNKKEIYGLIAEEVEQVNPSFASYNKEGRVETVNYEDLITPMLKALQDQKILIDELRREIEELKSGG